MEIYPDAKILLTIRDDGFKWADSINSSIGKMATYTGSKFHKLSAILGGKPPLKLKFRKLIFKKMVIKHDNFHTL